MKITVIKRKASSHKELGKEVYEIAEIDTLQDLLLEITNVQIQRSAEDKIAALTKAEIQQQASVGRVRFTHQYQQQQVSLQKANAQVVQAFCDGLFSVFIQGERIEELDTLLSLTEGVEVVFVQWMMLSGRLW